VLVFRVSLFVDNAASLLASNFRPQNVYHAGVLADYAKGIEDGVGPGLDFGGTFGALLDCSDVDIFTLSQVAMIPSGSRCDCGLFGAIKSPRFSNTSIVSCVHPLFHHNKVIGPAKSEHCCERREAICPIIECSACSKLIPQVLTGT
jgi:hypothetical protein